jgi:hypothetical protein
MGEARTACDGTFRIVSDAKDFRDFFEKRPDIHLRILCASARGKRPDRAHFKRRSAKSRSNPRARVSKLSNFQQYWFRQSLT